MSKLKLSNGVIYSIADYATPNNFTIILNSLSPTDVLESLTEENLSEIQFLMDNGMITGTYHNQLLYNYTGNENTLTIRINDVDLCRYGLILDSDKRIINAPAQRYAPEDAIIVDILPEGNITDYQYINNEYIYNPLPKEEDPVEPSPTLEDRVFVLENKVNKTITEYEESLKELGVEV